MGLHLKLSREVSIEKKKEFTYVLSAGGLEAPCRLVLAIAVAAIHWATLSGFEWDFTVLLAVIANGLVHFPWCPVVHF